MYLAHFLEYYDGLISLLTEDLYGDLEDELGLGHARSRLMNIETHDYCIFISDLNQNQYEFISDGAQKLLGYTPYEIKIMGFEGVLNIIHPKYRTWYVSVFNISAEKRRRLAVEERYRAQLNFTIPVKHKEGHYVWIESQSVPIKIDKHGKMEFVFQVLQNAHPIDAGFLEATSFLQILKPEGRFEKVKILPLNAPLHA